MHIGLIGGIGPAATVSYYEKLVAAFRAANVPLALTIAHADVEQLLAHVAEDRRDEQGRIFADHAGQLAAAGCDVVAITALTGHFCLSETKRYAPIPIVSAITPLDRYCQANQIDTVGLLGSEIVMSSHLFGQMINTRTVAPTDRLKDVGKTYITMARTGQCSDEARAFLFEQGEALCGKQAAQAILLAGTDLSLAFDGYDPGFVAIDAVDIHVAEILRLTQSS